MPPSLGQRLQQERKQRGLTLPDVAHVIRIPAARLQDLEEDNYNSLGSLTYAKGHLKSYAEFLGVNAAEVLEQMTPSPLGGRPNYRYLVESYGSLRAEREMPSMGERPSAVAAGRSSIITATVSAFAVMLVGGVLLANAFLNQGEPDASPPKSTQTSASQAGESLDEFTVLDAEVTLEPEEEIRKVEPAFTPPKATAVSAEPVKKSRGASIQVPKAVPVQ